MADKVKTPKTELHLKVDPKYYKWLINQVSARKKAGERGYTQSQVIEELIEKEIKNASS